MITDATVSRARFRLPTVLSLSVACIFGGIALCSVSSLHARPIPANLGNGLDRLLESDLVLQEAQASGKPVQTFSSASGKAYVNAETAALANLALGDKQGRLLVRINPDGTRDLRDLRRSLAATFGSLTVTALDRSYREVGVMNAYVASEDVAALAQFKGVRSVILELKPIHHRIVTKKADLAANVGTATFPDPNATPGQVLNVLGTCFDQGVTQHRVDQINRFYNPSAALDYQGAGLSIACLSNSFAANAANPASLDVINNDLPGNANNPVGNTTPVFVLQDDTGDNTSDDEGRGMCQIVYKMAPKAKVGFASADFGEVGFANNIRGLAGLSGFTAPGQTFAADVVCDDVGYFDEPFYTDGIIGNAIDDVAAAGVSYFSSAANDIGINGYESDLRWVVNGTGVTAAAGNAALAGTNINLTNVPPALYAGGFHNFNPNGLDVAQTVNIQTNANEPPTVMQWNEPYDQNTTPNFVQPPVFSTTGNYVATDLTFTVPATLTAGTLYELDERATGGSNFDGVITIKDPNGNIIVNAQDTQVDESVRFFAPVTGSGYTITIGRFQSTTGTFSLDLFATTGFSSVGVKTNISLLAFTAAGAYVPSSSLTTNTFATNQPIQLGTTLRSGGTQLQYVICRSNVPAPGPGVATRVRYQIPGNGLSGLGPAEYFTYNTVTTSGHATARGCNGTAAYSVFRPNVPEFFTSPGPATIYFDKNQNPLSTPEIRLQPGVAAADNANISINEGLAGLGGDTTSDIDAAANFSGTSAAAPHAAACALLVLEAKGGRRSVNPAAMTDLLHRSAFVHDLDPNSASGAARTTNGGKVNITINSDNESNTGTGVNDTGSFVVSYTGAGNLTSLAFNPNGSPAQGGAVSAGQNGLNATNAYFSNVTPGLYFATGGTGGRAFAFGTASLGLVSSDVTAVLSNPAPAPAPGTNQGQTLTLNFASGNFTGGKALRFTIGRALQRSSNVTTAAGTVAANYSADLFGGGVLIPEGTVIPAGMTFSGTTSAGGTFTGTLTNRLGAGYSKLDGFGFINVEQAVK